MNHTTDSQEAMTQANKIKYSAKERRWQNVYFMNILVQQSGFSLNKVPKELRTTELCRLAQQRNGTVLQYVPEKLRTAELCRLAVQQNGNALGFVPRKLRTAELCRLAVQQNGYALVYVPYELCTAELYRLAVQQNGDALGVVPEELRTAELCRLAVQQNGAALRYVLEELRTAELYRLAVQQNGDALDSVQRVLFLDSGFCLQMVKLAGISLNNVKDSFIDDTFVDAVLDHYRSLYFKQNTGHQLFTSYHQSNFFKQWQGVETKQETASNGSSLVSFYFQ